MKRAGLLVRKIARGSIRRGKLGGKPSEAPKPPKARTFGESKTETDKKGKPKRNYPFKQIVSLPVRGTEVVGMIGSNRTKGQPVPELHEKGGKAKRIVWTGKKGPRKRGKGGRFQKRAARKKSVKVVTYPKRAFMVPALETAKERLPRLWQGSISK